MKGFRFYADLRGTESEPTAAGGFYPDNIKRMLPMRSTIKQIQHHANNGGKLNVIALLLGAEHRGCDGSQECLNSTFAHADSDTSLGSVNRDYLRGCRRIPEALARQLHPRLFARLDANEG